jgi:hypothetical protein
MQCTTANTLMIQILSTYPAQRQHDTWSCMFVVEYQSSRLAPQTTVPVPDNTSLSSPLTDCCCISGRQNRDLGGPNFTVSLLSLPRLLTPLVMLLSLQGFKRFIEGAGEFEESLTGLHEIPRRPSGISMPPNCLSWRSRFCHRVTSVLLCLFFFSPSCHASNLQSRNRARPKVGNEESVFKIKKKDSVGLTCKR